MNRLQREIRQRTPFPHVEEEAYLNLVRTASALQAGVVAFLKPFGLTPSQYNVLRILRGAGAAGLPAGEIGERMVNRDPDITRLLDRLERSGLARRGHDARDRRIVRVKISERGTSLLKKLDGAMSNLHLDQLGHVGKRRLRTLVQLLEHARTLGS